MKPSRFWMVVGAGPSSCRHVSKEAAEQEAKRLASFNPGQHFYVTEAVSVHFKVDVQSISLREVTKGDRHPDDDIPF